MRIGGIILARFDSSRIPGKALAMVEGAPLLSYLVRRASKITLDGPLIVATSTRRVDDPIAEFTQAQGLGLHRGSLDDVAGRIVSSARAFDLDAVLRLNGDSPFLDKDLVSLAARAFRQGAVDFVTNLSPRCAPYGVTAEIFSVDALERCLAEASQQSDREHVTPALYRLLSPSRIVGLRPSDEGFPDYGQSPDLTRICLTVDEPADLAAFRNFVARFKDSWETVRIREAIESGLFTRRVTLPAGSR